MQYRGRISDVLKTAANYVCESRFYDKKAEISIAVTEIRFPTGAPKLCRISDSMSWMQLQLC